MKFFAQKRTGAPEKRTGAPGARAEAGKNAPAADDGTGGVGRADGAARALLARFLPRAVQRRIKGQNSLAEVAAISPRPAFPKHIAPATQRQAAAVPVIVGTPF